MTKIDWIQTHPVGASVIMGRYASTLRHLGAAEADRLFLRDVDEHKIDCVFADSYDDARCQFKERDRMYENAGIVIPAYDNVTFIRMVDFVLNMAGADAMPCYIDPAVKSEYTTPECSVAGGNEEDATDV